MLFHYLGTLVLRDVVPFLGWMDVGGHEKKMKTASRELDDMLEKWLEEHKQKRNLSETEVEKDFMNAMIRDLDGKSFEGYDADTINKATCLVSFFLFLLLFEADPILLGPSEPVTITGT